MDRDTSEFQDISSPYISSDNLRHSTSSGGIVGIFKSNRGRDRELLALEKDAQSKISSGYQKFSLSFSLLANGVSNVSMNRMIEDGQDLLLSMGLSVTGVDIDHATQRARLQVEVDENRRFESSRNSLDPSDLHAESESVWSSLSPEEKENFDRARIVQEDFQRRVSEGVPVSQAASDAILHDGLLQWGNTGVIQGLPVGQRIPDVGEFHVLWQYYAFGSNQEQAISNALEWMTMKTPWDFSYFVIDSQGKRMNVVGNWIDEEWCFFRRELDPHEYHVLWDAYIKAPDAVEAKQSACRSLETQISDGSIQFVADG